MELKQQVLELPTLLDELASAARDQATAKGLAFSFENALPAGRVLGDPMLIRRAVMNYIDNAVRFTPRGSIVLRAMLEPDGNGVVRPRIEVEDTGIGIAEEDVGRLFSIFEQGDGSQSRTYSGLGVGLAMSKRIAQAMGGDAGCRSVLGEGSLFWLSFALPDASQQ
jgi:signal transduction histidine kinase